MGKWIPVGKKLPEEFEETEDDLNFLDHEDEEEEEEYMDEAERVGFHLTPLGWMWWWYLYVLRF